MHAQWVMHRDIVSDCLCWQNSISHGCFKLEGYFILLLHNLQPFNQCLHNVKPANVLVTSEGRIKLADFGLARIFQAPTRPLVDDKVCGDAWFALTFSNDDEW
jgi:serine/threonine protein kinase